MYFATHFRFFNHKVSHQMYRTTLFPTQHFWKRTRNTSFDSSDCRGVKFGMFPTDQHRRSSLLPRTIIQNNSLCYISTSCHWRDLKKENAVKEAKPKEKPIEKPDEPDFTRLWCVERVVSASLLLIIPAALVVPCPALDVLFATSIVLHSHWGVAAVFDDYITPANCGRFAHALAQWLTLAFSAAILAGLLNFVYNDIGIAQAILCFWKVGTEEDDECQQDGVEKVEGALEKKSSWF